MHLTLTGDSGRDKAVRRKNTKLCAFFTDDLQSGGSLTEGTAKDPPIVLFRNADSVIGLAVKAIGVPRRLKEKP
jgi:hypothetical protein